MVEINLLTQIIFFKIAYKLTVGPYISLEGNMFFNL